MSTWPFWGFSLCTTFRDGPVETKNEEQETQGSSCCTLPLLRIFSGPNGTTLSFAWYRSQYLTNPVPQEAGPVHLVERVLEVHGQEASSSVGAVALEVACHVLGHRGQQGLPCKTSRVSPTPTGQRLLSFFFNATSEAPEISRRWGSGMSPSDTTPTTQWRARTSLSLFPRTSPPLLLSP